MYYATRSFPRTENTTEYQALGFQTKAQRDNFVNYIDGTAIGAREHNKLMFADIKHMARSVEAGCSYTVQRFIK